MILSADDDCEAVGVQNSHTTLLWDKDQKCAMRTKLFLAIWVFCATNWPLHLKVGSFFETETKGTRA